MKDQNLTRRAFLAATTTTAVVAWSGKVNAAQVVPKKVSPNEKVNIASIGSGGKGYFDIMNFKRENVLATCDVDWKSAEECFYRLPDAKRYKDYRKMLEELTELDAVTISTPDHTHAPAAYMAMQLGLHVYVQKPLAHTVKEIRFLTKVARETGVTTQMGNQGHSGDGCRELCEMMWSGAIGEVKEAHIWTNRPSWPQGIAEPLPVQAIPETMAWDLWIGTAGERAYNEKYAPHNWRGWWDFGCGAIGDMACHIMDPAFWSLKLGEAKTFSVELVSQEGLTKQTGPLKSSIKYEFPARADMPATTVYWHDGGNLPQRPADIPEDQEIGDGKNGSLYIGTNGYLTAGEYGGKPRLLPDARMADYKKPDPTIERVSGQNHYRNFLDGIKDGIKPCSNFDYAGPLTEVANMGNIALRVGHKIEFDVDACAIANDSEANALLTKEYRAGWELPIDKYV